MKRGILRKVTIGCRLIVQWRRPRLAATVVFGCDFSIKLGLVPAQNLSSEWCTIHTLWHLSLVRKCQNLRVMSLIRWMADRRCSLFIAPYDMDAHGCRIENLSILKSSMEFGSGVSLIGTTLLTRMKNSSNCARLTHLTIKSYSRYWRMI